jgi:uncharacterized protein
MSTFSFTLTARTPRTTQPAVPGWKGSSTAYGLSDLVLSGFVRVVTHPKVFTKPSSIAKAIEFTEQLRGQPNCVPVFPGPRHWDIFRALCVDGGVRGNLVPDAFLAAMAIESGCEWITTDRDFARFKGLRWRHPVRQGG